MIALVASHFRQGTASRKRVPLRPAGQHGRHLSVVRSAPNPAASPPASRHPSERLEPSELAALDNALRQAANCARAAYDKREPWANRVRGALASLLGLFDEQPQLARLCVVQSAMIGNGALARREEILAALARVIDEGRDSTRRQQPPPLTARGVVAGTIGAVRARLQQPEPEPLSELLNPLMSFIVLPYLGAGAARRELSRRAPGRGTGRSPSARVADPPRVRASRPRTK
jgi:hypothetical protein